MVNAKGEHVGELEELFPLHGNITEMVLTYGRWVENIPGKIRMHIINPAVSGDHDLPALSWSGKKLQPCPA
ncbi:MAG: hypothetical protein MZV65_16685 [Chromatiales bacterium]|nr:hypothetical protein [Chromatiales bacterium]